MATQREAYYCLVQHFKNQSEFNDTLQGYRLYQEYMYSSVHAMSCLIDYFSICQLPRADVVALTGCARSSLGVCASSSGAIAGLLLWQVANISSSYMLA